MPDMRRPIRDAHVPRDASMGGVTVADANPAETVRAAASAPVAAQVLVAGSNKSVLS
jgi:hypothetical protein